MTEILSVVRFCYDTWSLTIREENKLRELHNWALKNYLNLRGTSSRGGEECAMKTNEVSQSNTALKYLSSNATCLSLTDNTLQNLKNHKYTCSTHYY